MTSEQQRTQADYEREADAAVRRGDHLAAFDLSCVGMRDSPESVRLRYFNVLSLARMGDTDKALAAYETLGLGATDDVDHLSLRGRLLKDVALAAPAAERAGALRAASQAYREVYERTGSDFPGVNAATLALLAGEEAEARIIAAAILAGPETATDYFAVATHAEAQAILGDWDGAVDTLASATCRAGADHSACVSTLRQIELLAAHVALDPAMLERIRALLRPRPVIVYTGHMFDDDHALAAAEADIERALDRIEAGVGYGALAYGSDILIAEALLRRGGELNVVLPFARDDFVRYSVAPAGGDWVARFERCMAAAATVQYASEAGYVGDPHQFRYGSLVAMGLARLRAGNMLTDAVMLAIWDGVSASGPAGTAADIIAWERRGGGTVTIDAGPRRGPRAQEPTQPHERDLRAMIFSDFSGFSKLSETDLPRFWAEVMGTAADVLDRYGARVVSRNSWGDALFVVTEDAITAAEVVLDLQEALGLLRGGPEAKGLIAGMRFGVHFGPVYIAADPVTKQPNVFGTEVTRTARIEPITPIGEVYVTQAYAAILAMEASERFATPYVGLLPLAKGFGAFKMHRLSRR